MTNLNHKNYANACLLTSIKMLMLIILGTLNFVTWAAEHVVLNNQAHGIGSLADAIEQTRLIPGPDTIRFDEIYFSQFREIAINFSLELEEEVEIIGPSKDLLTIIAKNGTYRDLFTIKATSNGNIGNLHFENLSIKIANDGAISPKRLILAVASNVSLENVSLIGNSVQLSNGSGSAIAIENGNLSLKNCRVENFLSEYRGGAIFANFVSDTDNYAITIDNCALTNNAVVGAINSSYAVSGGAIYVFDISFSSTMVISNSEISHNSATGSGGGLVLNRQSATIINSTISNNSANEDGGGIFIANGSKPTRNELILQSSTVTENHSDNGRGGIGVAGSPRIKISIVNSIVANNTKNGEGVDEIGSSELTASYSLIGDKPGDEGNFTFDNTVMLNTDPMLGPLANNGGTTRTHAILNNSPLIDAGDNNAYDYRITPPSYDQRGTGFARNQGSDTDIGAFEFNTTTSCKSCGGGPGEGGGGSIFFVLLPLALLCVSKIRPAKTFGNVKGVNP